MKKGHSSQKNYNPERHQDCYSYQLKYTDAINLIKDIYPYLIIKTKRKRAELILKKYKSVTPRNGRSSKEMLKSNIDFYS